MREDVCLPPGDEGRRLQALNAGPSATLWSSSVDLFCNAELELFLLLLNLPSNFNESVTDFFLVCKR